MAPIPASTVLLTKNNAASLPAYFASMKDIDDIILLDGGSTDGTLEIAKSQPNCRVYPQNPQFLDENGYIIDFSGMRNYGYTLAKHRWILCVDADETASPQLIDEVRRIVEEGKPGVYFARRVFYWKDKPVVMFSKSTSDQIRLFHLDWVRGCVKPVHERLDIIPGAPVGMLQDVVHVPLGDPTNLRRKYDRYIRIEVDANRTIGFGRWFRWIFLRNLINIPRRILSSIAIRLIPMRGQRFPYSLEWEQIRYSWLITWRTCPLLRKR